MSRFILGRAAWEMYSLYGLKAKQVCDDNAAAARESGDLGLERSWKEVGKAADEIRPTFPGQKHLHEARIGTHAPPRRCQGYLERNAPPSARCGAGLLR